MISVQDSFRLRPQAKTDAVIKELAIGGSYEAGAMVDIVHIGVLANPG